MLRALRVSNMHHSKCERCGGSLRKFISPQHLRVFEVALSHGWVDIAAGENLQLIFAKNK